MKEVEDSIRKETDDDDEESDGTEAFITKARMFTRSLSNPKNSKNRK